MWNTILKVIVAVIIFLIIVSINVTALVNAKRAVIIYIIVLFG